ncbi:hypothetical protein Tsubulata_027665, partial [Turnera subulata]
MNRKKVLFAEAGKDFVDFLVHLLSLPVGTVVKLLKKAATVGCISNLYSSLEGLSETYMQPNQNKDAILTPRLAVQVSSSSLLLPDIEAHQNKIYRCPSHYQYVTHDSRNTCPSCRSTMHQEVQFVDSNKPADQGASGNGEEGYVKGLVTYMVTDDLSISPMSMISGVTLLNKFNVPNFAALDEKVVELGINEGLALLKAALLSKGKMSIKLLIDKDRKKVLFAEAEKDFVDFLIHPLYFLKKAATVGCISNLQSSLEVLCESHMLLSNLEKDAQSSHNKIYRCPSHSGYVTHDSSNTCPSCRSTRHQEVQFVGTNKSAEESPIIDGEGGGYVKGLVTYIVTDDLSIFPMSMMSGVTLLKKFNVTDFAALEEEVVEVDIDDELLIDNNRKKVLFAEAGKDFVDFLIHLLSLPVGTVVKLLKKAATVGCISNLYSSLEGLSDSYLQPNQNKDALLRPRLAVQISSSSLLLPEIPAEPPLQKKQLYRCTNNCHGYITEERGKICPSCNYYRMDQAVQFVGTNNSADKNPNTHGSEGGFVKGVVTYMVMDDLSISPMSMISGVSLLINKFNVKDFGALEEKVVQLGIDEGLELLKAALLSDAALTEVFLANKAARRASRAK